MNITDKTICLIVGFFAGAITFLLVTKHDAPTHIMFIRGEHTERVLNVPLTKDLVEWFSPLRTNGNIQITQIGLRGIK